MTQRKAVTSNYGKNSIQTLLDLFSGLYTVKQHFLIKDAVINQQEDLNKEIAEVLDILVDEIQKDP